MDELIDDVDLNLIDTADEMPNTDVEESDKSE